MSTSNDHPGPGDVEADSDSDTCWTPGQDESLRKLLREVLPRGGVAGAELSLLEPLLTQPGVEDIFFPGTGPVKVRLTSGQWLLTATELPHPGSGPAAGEGSR